MLASSIFTVPYHAAKRAFAKHSDKTTRKVPAKVHVAPEEVLLQQRYNLYINAALDEIAQTLEGKTLNETLETKIDTPKNTQRVAAIQAITRGHKTFEYQELVKGYIKSQLEASLAEKINTSVESIISHYDGQLALQQSKRMDIATVQDKLIQQIATVLGQESVSFRTQEAIKQAIKEADEAIYREEGERGKVITEAQEKILSLTKKSLDKAVDRQAKKEWHILEKAANRIKEDTLSQGQGSRGEKMAKAHRHLGNLAKGTATLDGSNFYGLKNVTLEVAQHHLEKLQGFQAELDAERAKEIKPFYKALSKVLSTATHTQQQQIISRLGAINGTGVFLGLEHTDFSRDPLLKRKEQQKEVETKLYRAIKNTEFLHAKEIENLRSGKSLVGEAVKARRGEPSPTKDTLKKIMPNKKSEIENIFTHNHKNVYEPLATEAKLRKEDGLLKQAEVLVSYVAPPRISPDAPQKNRKAAASKIAEEIAAYEKAENHTAAAVLTAQVTKSNPGRLFPAETPEHILAGVLLSKTPSKLMNELLQDVLPGKAVKALSSSDQPIKRPMEKLLAGLLYAKDAETLFTDTVVKNGKKPIHDLFLIAKKKGLTHKNIKVEESLAKGLLATVLFATNPEEKISKLLEEATPEQLFTEGFLETHSSEEIEVMTGQAKDLLKEAMLVGEGCWVKEYLAKELLAEAIFTSNVEARVKGLLDIATPQDILHKQLLEDVPPRKKMARFKEAKELLSEELLSAHKPKGHKPEKHFRFDEGARKHTIDANERTKYLAPHVGEEGKLCGNGKRRKHKGSTVEEVALQSDNPLAREPVACEESPAVDRVSILRRSRDSLSNTSMEEMDKEPVMGKWVRNVTQPATGTKVTGIG